MSRTTPATLALDKAGVAYRLATYDYDPGAERVGLQAAAALGAPPGEVLKTLMVKADGKPACVVLASDREVSMKKPDQAPAPYWNYYFKVGDIDAAAARAKAGGAQILMGPMEVPSGDWVFQGIDPQGAMFSVQGHKGG